MTALAEPVYIDDTADVLEPEQIFTKQVGDATVRLTASQLDQFGEELDAIRNRVLADLGERDADYIRNIMKLQRKLDVYGRGMLFLGILPPFWLAGTAMLGASKILDNMEIGHNVMHGQYDWMGDPGLRGQEFEWDNACPSNQWRYTHNYMHHTYTNVVDLDRDIGYGVLRMSKDQPWQPYYLGNPVYAFLLMVLFQYGVALHELEAERVLAGQLKWRDRRDVMKEIWGKVKKQTLKDYVAYPLLAGPFAPVVFTGNAVANLIRNVWSYTIIFCGHFPAGVSEFSLDEARDESRGHWYFRQVLGSANISGGKWFHIFSGNLSFQIEHHLFPDLPAHRYQEISPEVQDICRRYGIPYNSGPLHKQFGSVIAKIIKLALPPGLGGVGERRPRRKVPRTQIRAEYQAQLAAEMAGEIVHKPGDPWVKPYQVKAITAG